MKRRISTEPRFARFERVAALVALALALVTGCSTTRSVVATRAPATSKAPSKPKPVFLWRTASDKATVYLLGSIHVARKDLYPLPRVIDDAFARADTLVLETELDATSIASAAFEIVRHAMLAPPDSLDRHLSPETAGKLRKYLTAHHLAPDAFERFQPWFVAMALPALEADEQGYSSDEGIDVHFRDLAEGKKRILSLEPIDAQVKLLLGLGDVDQEQLLLGALDTESGNEDLDRLFELWKAGDAKAFAAFEMQDRDMPGSAELYRRFLYARNENMDKVIEGYLETSGTYFVVVGCAHLVGERSVVDLLRQHGHTVEQLSRR